MNETDKSELDQLKISELAQLKARVEQLEKENCEKNETDYLSKFDLQRFLIWFFIGFIISRIF